MRILNVENGKKRKGIIIKAIMGVPEFEQLNGNLDNLCVFATKNVKEKSSVTKTGARHSYAKYLLFPVKLRRQFRATEFEFEKILCGTSEYKDALYVVYKVKKKTTTTSKSPD